MESAARDEARNRIEHHRPVDHLSGRWCFGSGAYLEGPEWINQARRAFAQAAVHADNSHGVGMIYLAVCEAAAPLSEDLLWVKG